MRSKKVLAMICASSGVRAMVPRATGKPASLSICWLWYSCKDSLRDCTD